MTKSNFKYKARFEIGPCPYRGEKNFCNGKFNGTKCMFKFAFLGLIYVKNGWKHRSIFKDEKSFRNREPDYVEWGLKWKGKNEFIAVIEAGFLLGLKRGVDEPCIYQVLGFTNKGIIKIFNELLKLTPFCEENITNYLIARLGAPKNIRKIVLAKLSKPIEPRFVEIL